jgi:GNAT superfamily N-acetyltransferase
MNVIDRNVPLTMVRRDLDGVPRFDVPAGFTLRPFASGDEEAWVWIHAAADRYNEATLARFRSEFGDDAATLERRMRFLVDPTGSAIGTAAAWFDHQPPGPLLGRVHWVAIHPAHQGRGLAKPLLSHVCALLRDLGHERTFLTTSSARIPAIALYLRFGFEPEIDGSDSAAAWAELRRHLTRATYLRTTPKR